MEWNSPGSVLAESFYNANDNNKFGSRNITPSRIRKRNVYSDSYNNSNSAPSLSPSKTFFSQEQSSPGSSKKIKTQINDFDNNDTNMSDSSYSPSSSSSSFNSIAGPTSAPISIIKPAKPRGCTILDSPRLPELCSLGLSATPPSSPYQYLPTALGQCPQTPPPPAYRCHVTNRSPNYNMAQNGFGLSGRASPSARGLLGNRNMSQHVNGDRFNSMSGQQQSQQMAVPSPPLAPVSGMASSSFSPGSPPPIDLQSPVLSNVLTPPHSPHGRTIFWS